MFKRTLIIAPHFDDETIGCGGLLASLSEDPTNQVLIVFITTPTNMEYYNVGRIVSNKERRKEAIEALSILGVKESSVIQLEGFEEGMLDTYSMKKLVTELDKVIREFRPTAVLFPYSSHHQDHHVVYKASIAALRPTVNTNFIKLKAMYEYPYVNSWSSNLNLNSKLYYCLSEEVMEKKRQALSAYETQLIRNSKDILNVESIMLLAKVRGVEICQEYAEAFYPMTQVI